MKKIYSLTIIQLLLQSLTSIAQCTSSATSYDLTVNTNVVLHPLGTSYLFAGVCPGGVLLDSLSCCTRFVHVEAGGTYETGPMAYGIVYVKAGGTFDAHGNTGVFNVYYETGATILNFTGPTTLCNSISFPPMNCSVEIEETDLNKSLDIFPNPSDGKLIIEMDKSIVTGNFLLVKILNILGDEVINKEWIIDSGNCIIDMSNKEKGIYFAEIKTEKEIINRKIIIQ